MSKISGISEIQALLRQQAGRLSESDRLRSGSGAAENSGTSRSRQIDLAQVVEKAYKRAKGDQFSVEDKIRIIIRAILSWEFGNDILDDVQSIELSERILQHIETNAVLKAKICRLFDAV
ncbi:hypothetical protein [Gynuella sunshinyii]|uniref:Uncharacterized protein n=1 Tax=Gynuella sunshinyii YC6258 TaxID=1445510 RepID=A0A0C5VEY9_9GAMM|nr:hypothetical protein [Gynuella sunshinyii]AJQ92731.1 hypothetical Protein YC6258_00681 [Gynuella sunshinyii YC6258]